MASTAAKYITLLSGGNYLSTIRSIPGIVALWPLSEAAGAASVTDSVGGFTGTPSNVTFAATTFPDGTPAPSFNGASSAITLPVETLTNVFTPTSFTLAAWAKVNSIANWTDGVFDVICQLGADVSNRYFLAAANHNNVFTAYGNQGGSPASAAKTTSSVQWMHVALINNASTSTRTLAFNGEIISVTGTGTYAGVLSNSWCAIGNLSPDGGANSWNGWLKYVTLWNRALTPAEVATLYVSSFAV